MSQNACFLSRSPPPPPPPPASAAAFESVPATPPSFSCFIIWRIAACYASLIWVWLAREEVTKDAEADAPPKPSSAAAVTWFWRRLEER